MGTICAIMKQGTRKPLCSEGLQCCNTTTEHVEHYRHKHKKTPIREEKEIKKVLGKRKKQPKPSRSAPPPDPAPEQKYRLKHLLSGFPTPLPDPVRRTFEGKRFVLGDNLKTSTARRLTPLLTALGVKLVPLSDPQVDVILAPSNDQIDPFRGGVLPHPRVRRVSKAAFVVSLLQMYGDAGMDLPPLTLKEKKKLKKKKKEEAAKQQTEETDRMEEDAPPRKKAKSSDDQPSPKASPAKPKAKSPRKSAAAPKESPKKKAPVAETPTTPATKKKTESKSPRKKETPTKETAPPKTRRQSLASKPAAPKSKPSSQRKRKSIA